MTNINDIKDELRSIEHSAIKHQESIEKDFEGYLVYAGIYRTHIAVKMKLEYWASIKPRVRALQKELAAALDAGEG